MTKPFVNVADVPLSFSLFTWPSGGLDDCDSET